MENTMIINENNQAPKKGMATRKVKRAVFYALVMALPLLQFAIFYIYVNFNSFMLSFQKFVDWGEPVFAGMDNIKVAFEKLTSSGYMFKNSFILYLINTLFVMPVTMFFAYYLSKQYLGSGIFKTLLFLPHIVSGLVLAIIFKYVTTDVYLAVQGMMGAEVSPNGLLYMEDTAFITILFYNVFIGFGSHILMFTGAMSGVDDSVIESAQLDGVTTFQEFWYITVPMIWPTFTTFFVTGLAGLFTNQMGLMNLYGSKGVQSELYTMGYFLFIETKGSNTFVEPGSRYMSYSELSALGLLLTFIVAPLTLISKKLLRKYGPSVD